MISKKLAVILFSCLLFYECATTRKVTYNIPADYPEARRKQIIDLFYKGEELYKANCAECHGIFTKGKDNIPNFTNQQLDNYGSSFVMGDRKNHAVAMKMTLEQLNQTLLFLRFKKPLNTDSTKLRQPKS